MKDAQIVADIKDTLNTNDGFFWNKEVEGWLRHLVFGHSDHHVSDCKCEDCS